MARTNRVIAVCNQKGGVGKTTTSINLSASLAAMEKRVLLIDFDPQANSSQGLGHSRKGEADISAALAWEDSRLTRENLAPLVVETELPLLKLLPCYQDLGGFEFEAEGVEGREGKLSRICEALRPDYDYILLDSPPSLNLFTVNVLVAADAVIIPIQCEYYALTGLAEVMKIIRLMKKNHNPRLRIEGVLLTMYDARLNLSRQVVEDVRQNLPGQVFETVIPRSVRLAEAPSFGKPILLYDAANIGAKRYLELAKEVISHE